MIRAPLLLMTLAGCSGTLCEVLPKADFRVTYHDEVVVQGIHVGGHWNPYTREIRMSHHAPPWTLYHEIHHAGLTDAGVPSKDHHAEMARCGG